MDDDTLGLEEDLHDRAWRIREAQERTERILAAEQKPAFNWAIWIRGLKRIKKWPVVRTRIAFGSLSYNTRYMLTHPWEYIRWLRDEVRWFVQRGLYGYATCDWWSINSYLLTWLPSCLRTMAKEAHGHPPALSSVAEWQNILLDMALGFELGKRYFDEHEGRVPEEYTRAMELLVKWWWNLWD